MIESIDIDTKSVLLKIVPRIGQYNKNKFNRPPKKLFYPEEYQTEQMTRDRQNRITMNNNTYENGFLIKKFKIRLLDNKNFIPSLEEINLFNKHFDKTTQNRKLNQLMSKNQDYINF